jgi:hypothetical protein
MLYNQSCVIDVVLIDYRRVMSARGATAPRAGVFAFKYDKRQNLDKKLLADRCVHDSTLCESLL